MSTLCSFVLHLSRELIESIFLQNIFLVHLLISICDTKLETALGAVVPMHKISHDLSKPLAFNQFTRLNVKVFLHLQIGAWRNLNFAGQ